MDAVFGPEERKPCISLTPGNQGSTERPLTPPVRQQSAQQPDKVGVKLFSPVTFFFFWSSYFDFALRL